CRAVTKSADSPCEDLHPRNGNQPIRAIEWGIRAYVPTTVQRVRRTKGTSTCNLLANSELCESYRVYNPWRSVHWDDEGCGVFPKCNYKGLWKSEGRRKAASCKAHKVPE